MQTTAAIGQLRPLRCRAASRQRQRAQCVTCAVSTTNSLGRRELLAAGAATLTASNIFFGPSGNAAFASDGPSSIYQLSGSLDGQEFPFSQFRDKVVFIVNVASQ